VLKFAKNASSDGVPVLVVTAAHVWVESEMNRLFLLMLNTRPDVRCVFVSYADEPRKQDFRSETSHVCNWVEVPMLSTAQVVSVCEKATRNMTGVTTDAVVHAAQSLPLPLLAACKSILNLLQTPAFARARNLRPRMLLPCSVLPVEDDARRQTFSVEDVERAAALLRGAKMDDRAMYSMLAERLPSLLQNLKSRVFGQDAALDKIVTTVTERVLLRDSDDAAPIATMIFLGPTGTGKTETARCLAEFLLNARDGCLTKFDMSEFKDHENITKLLGTTAGFIGFNNTPLLTDALRKQLPRIMLFDEAEKADPEVFDLFLSVFDKDGTITDGAGRTLAFRQTLVVLTSNIGSNAVSDEDAKQQLLTFFKPEFLARIDCVVRFSPLSHVAQKSIVQRALDAVQRKFAELGIVFDMDSQLVDFFSAKVQTLGGGARSVVRCVNTEFALLFKHELVSRIKVKGVRVCCLNDTLTRVDAAQGHAQQHAGQTSEAHD
jgi:ATP-dependent Clp protease ATP-binding subunit ClpA